MALKRIIVGLLKSEKMAFYGCIIWTTLL